MKGYIVLFKVKDEDAEEFSKLLMDDYVHKTHNISKIADVKGVSGGDSYERSENVFYHNL